MIAAILQENEVEAVKQIMPTDPGAEALKQTILRGIEVEVEAMKQIIRAEQEAEALTQSLDEVKVPEALSRSSMGGVRDTGGVSSGPGTLGASEAEISERLMVDCRLRTIIPTLLTHL